ncbi:MAG: hypothetical protein P8P74_14330 [Crocinitomicaceae bacterium]|nr:hypothetical protein [Crocinitomicaceae bacterium]
MKQLLFLLALGLSACSSNAEMKSVQYDYLINDGNSKVWMIEQMIVGKSNITPQLDHEKEILIFYQSASFQYIPVKQLGNKVGKTGDYFLDSDEKALKLYFDDESIWEFNLTEISEDSIYLVPTAQSDVGFSMQLVPLKELF